MYIYVCVYTYAYEYQRKYNLIYEHRCRYKCNRTRKYQNEHIVQHECVKLLLAHLHAEPASVPHLWPQEPRKEPRKEPPRPSTKPQTVLDPDPLAAFYDSRPKAEGGRGLTETRALLPAPLDLLCGGCPFDTSPTIWGLH